MEQSKINYNVLRALIAPIVSIIIYVFKINVELLYLGIVAACGIPTAVLGLVQIKKTGGRGILIGIIAILFSIATFGFFCYLDLQ